MTTNPFLPGAYKPEGARAAHLPLGLFSPMWLPFMAAAGVGAAWWTLQNWPRLAAAATTGSAKLAAQPGAAGDAAQAASVVESYGAAAEAPAAPPARRTEQLAEAFASAPVADTLVETLSVQGDDAQSETAERQPAPEAEPAPRAQAPEPALESAAEAAPAQSAAPVIQAAVQGSNDDSDGEHSKPEPELPPHEGLPARKKGGGKKKG